MWRTGGWVGKGAGVCPWWSLVALDTLRPSKAVFVCLQGQLDHHCQCCHCLQDQHSPVINTHLCHTIILHITKSVTLYTSHNSPTQVGSHSPG
jgi:hypothetical protein